MRTLGDRIRSIREEKQISQEEMAGHLGIRQKQVSRIETNLGVPSYPLLLKIAEYADVSLDWLAGRADDRRGFIIEPVDRENWSAAADEAAELINSLGRDEDQRFALNMLSFTVTELRLRGRGNSGQ